MATQQSGGGLATTTGKSLVQPGTGTAVKTTGPLTSPGVTGTAKQLTTPSFESQLKGSQRDAFVALNTLFTSYGLGTLAPKIFDFIKQGYSADTISLLLQQTNEYKQRFAGNELRRKAGLAVLQPAEYLATEASYRQILSSAGMPKGFYDQTSDFVNWIGGDVSPTEVQDRVNMALQFSTNANPAAKEALKQLYGIDDTGVAAYFLDSKRAEPLLKKQAAAAEIGAAALQAGFNVDKGYFESFATEGITAGQAQQSFAMLADTYQPLKNIAARYGEDWTQGEAERDVFEPGHMGQASGFTTDYTSEGPSEKAARLKSQERALFAGQQGSSTMGLGNIYRAT